MAILEGPESEAISLGLLQDPLEAGIERLGELRFLLVLTARLEGSSSIGPERRLKLRRDLGRLRRQYADKIDEIAMGFGVQQAMDAKELVERTVKVPRGIQSPEGPADDEQGWF
ncbi:MAG: hypothetical protein ACLGSH_16170 [Acidobacteriota bacterium]